MLGSVNNLPKLVLSILGIFYNIEITKVAGAANPSSSVRMTSSSNKILTRLFLVLISSELRMSTL